MVNLIKIASVTLSLGSHVARQNTSCPAAPVCPTHNGCISTAANGAKFQVSCDTDYLGYDLETANVKTYKDCLYACSITQKCVAVSYTEEGYCYLKSKVNPRPAHNSVIEGGTLTGPSRASPTPLPLSFCPTRLNCPSTKNCIFSVGPFGLPLQPYAVYCATDYYGGDLSNAPAADAAACINQCALSGQCVAISYKISTKMCYLKKKLEKPVYSPDVVGAKPILNLGVLNLGGLFSMGAQLAGDIVGDVLGVIDGGL